MQTSDSPRIALAGPVLTEPLAKFLDWPGAGLPSGLGGTPVWQLASDLLERGQRVSVVTLDLGVSAPLVASGPMLDVAYGPYRPRRRMRDLMRVERRAVRDGVVSVRPDIVHAHWCGEYALGALASGLPTLVTAHDWMPAILKLMKARHWPYWSGRAVLYFATLARARYLTAVAPYVAEKIRHLSTAAIEVVPNGIPDAVFLQGASRPERETGNRQRVLLSVNDGFGPRKNVKRLLEAHQVAVQRGVQCELHLIGEGYEVGGPCERWARQRGLAGHVSFLGSLPHIEVLQRMGQATAFVHPAREEACCMTIIEAMSQQLPVIGGKNSGGVPWELDHGGAGLLVDVTDPRSIADAIEAVLTQETLRRRLGSDGYRHAWGNFRQTHVTDLYLDAYRRLLDEVTRR